MDRAVGVQRTEAVLSVFRDLQEISAQVAPVVAEDYFGCRML
jgi:hypothetical protein